MPPQSKQDLIFEYSQKIIKLNHLRQVIKDNVRILDLTESETKWINIYQVTEIGIPNLICMLDKTITELKQIAIEQSF